MAVQVGLAGGEGGVADQANTKYVPLLTSWISATQTQNSVFRVNGSGAIADCAFVTTSPFAGLTVFALAIADVALCGSVAFASRAVLHFRVVNRIERQAEGCSRGRARVWRRWKRERTGGVLYTRGCMKTVTTLAMAMDRRSVGSEMRGWVGLMLILGEETVAGGRHQSNEQEGGSCTVLFRTKIFHSLLTLTRRDETRQLSFFFAGQADDKHPGV